MAKGIPSSSSDEKEKKEFSDLLTNFSNYIHSIGVDSANIHIMDRNSSNIVNEVTRILGKRFKNN